jgi:hypothetical protein
MRARITPENRHICQVQPSIRRYASMPARHAPSEAGQCWLLSSIRRYASMPSVPERGRAVFGYRYVSTPVCQYVSLKSTIQRMGSDAITSIHQYISYVIRV